MFKSIVIKNLLKELNLFKKELAIVMICIGAVSFSMLSLGHTIKLFVDYGIKTHDLESLNQTIIFLAIAVIILSVGSFFRSFYINSISDKVVSNIRQKTYKSLLQHKVQYFDEIHISDIISRFSHDLSLIGDIITNLISFSIRNLFLIIGGMVMMFVQDVKLSLIVMLSVTICFVMISRLGKKVRVIAKDLHSMKAKIEEIIGETISNIRVVYAFNIRDYRIEKLEKTASESALIANKYLGIRSLFFAMAICVVSSLLLLVLWIGGIDVIENRLSSGNMISFIFYAVFTAFSIGGIAEVVGEMQKSFAAAERIFELQTFEKDESILGDVFSEKIERIKIYIPEYIFPARPEIKVLSNINIELKAGEFIGIAGPSGSGKSTLLQMIIGLYNSSGTRIEINGIEEDLSGKSIAKKIAYVPQDPFLFSETIEENIVLGRAGGDLEEVIKITGLDEVIKLMPNGLKTYVGERGMQLSGGQKQRISLARSIYANPDILLLDEATSALDLNSENHVIEHLRKKMKDKIIISVAHRLSSIKKANKILIMYAGELVEEGSHEDLMKNSPLYKHLNAFLH